MKLLTIVIDDEPIALEKLRNYASKVPFIDLVAAFDNSLEALSLLGSQSVDLIITDIEMPDLNGLDFVASLADRPMVIFVTAYDHYAVESYKVQAVDYLLKPYSFADFQKAVNRALELKKSSVATGQAPPASMFVKTDTRYIKVDLADILYIKGYGEYLQIFLRSVREPLITLSSFAAVKQYLGPNFLQVHRSYIVNMDNIDMVERYHISIAPDVSIPVSDTFRQDLIQYLTNRTIGRIPRQK